MKCAASGHAVSDVAAATGADASRLAVVMAGADGTVTAYNLAAELLLGREARDVAVIG